MAEEKISRNNTAGGPTESGVLPDEPSAQGVSSGGSSVQKGSADEKIAHDAPAGNGSAQNEPADEKIVHDAPSGASSMVLGTDEWYELVKTGANVCVNVVPTGRSMRPLIVGGRDSVLIKPATGPLKKGDIVLFKRTDGANVLHRLWRIGKAGTLTTYGDGCAAPDRPIRRDQVRGVAVQLTRKGRTYRLDGAASRFQGRVWWVVRPIVRFPRRAAHKVIREWLGIKRRPDRGRNA